MQFFLASLYAERLAGTDTVAAPTTEPDRETEPVRTDDELVSASR